MGQTHKVNGSSEAMHGRNRTEMSALDRFDDASLLPYPPFPLLSPPLISRLLLSTVLPDNPEAGLEDERCPLQTGCDRAGAMCVCDARHSCLGSFSYPDMESCMRASKTGEFPTASHQEQKIHSIEHC